MKSPQADLNKVPFLCPLSPRSQQDFCTCGILYHCSDPSGISAAQLTPPYLPKSIIPRAGCPDIPIPAPLIHIPVSFQGLARPGCCFCPPTAVGQGQKSSSGAEVEISPGITAPRGDKTPAQEQTSGPALQSSAGTRSSALFSWHRVQAFEDKEESLVQPAGN